MKILGKINLAIFSIIIGFILAIGLVFYSNNLSSQLRDMEFHAIKVLRDFYKMTDETKALMLRNIDLTVLHESWRESLDDFKVTFNGLRDHRATHLLSAGLQEELDRTLSVWELTEFRFEESDQNIQFILDTDEIYDFNKKGIYPMLTNFSNQKGVSGIVILKLSQIHQNLEAIDLAAKEFMVGNLQHVIEQLGEQANSLISTSYYITIAIIVVIAVLSALFSIFFSRGLASRIRLMEDTMRIVNEKDLTIRTVDKRRDELGSLAGHINSVLVTLSDFLREVHSAAHNVEELKDSLSTGTTESASALNEITKNIESMNEQFETLNQYIEATSGAVSSIGAGISQLSTNIGDQSKSIQSSSSSIEEMNASIQSVAGVSNEHKDRAVDLLRVIAEGGDKVTSTNDIIKSITREITDMLEIIEIINNVSEQTNLLSMNAAIESAHAGEAGKGFAVVAEEIRKLAESTSENAMRIDHSLKSITEKIKEALYASEASHQSFEDINTDVSKFVDALTEISSSMAELSSGSNEILKTTEIISSSTKEIERSAEDMSSRTQEIELAMKESSLVSSGIVNGMSEIEKGSKEILSAVMNINDISEESRARMQELHDKVETYKTEDEEELSEELLEENEGLSHSETDATNKAENRQSDDDEADITAAEEEVKEEPKPFETLD